MHKHAEFLCCSTYYWFIAVVLIGELHLVLSHLIVYTGKDYNLETHKNTVAEYATYPGDDPSTERAKKYNKLKNPDKV
ncbi:hypothetical protein B0H14DRAFT_3423957 [Mycena olivaceomarginata]|nr:hypothetical protein B0H14DRAFT_3423957 [Mycena olivaceomarginata]